MKQKTLKQLRKQIQDLKISLDNIEIYEPEHEHKHLIIDEYLSELHSLYVEYELIKRKRNTSYFMIGGFIVLTVILVIVYRYVKY